MFITSVCFIAYGNIKIISIYLSTYIAPFKVKFYSEALPAQARPKRREESLEKYIKRTGKVTWQRTKVRGKTIPNRGTHNRKSPFLSGDSASTWDHKIPLGGRPERSATRAGRSIINVQVP